MSRHSLNNQLTNRNESESFYSRLYASLFERLMSAGLSVSDRSEVVEDTVQEVFQYFLEDKSKLQNVNNIEAYLVSMLKRRLFKKISHERKTTSIDYPSLPFYTPSHETTIIDVEETDIQIKRIRNAVDKLSAGEAHAIRSKFYKGESYEQIAVKNNSTKRTVYNQVHNGVKKLKKLLDL